MFRKIFLKFHETKNYFVKISENTKFWQNNFDFREIFLEFRENEIKNFVKISQNEIKNFVKIS